MDELDATAREWLADYRAEVTPSAQAQQDAWPPLRARLDAPPPMDHARRRRRIALLAIAGLGIAAAAVLVLGRGSTRQLTATDERVPSAPYVAPAEPPQPTSTRAAANEAAAPSPATTVAPSIASEPTVAKPPTLPRERAAARARTDAPARAAPTEAPSVDSLAAELAILEPADAALRAGRATRALELYERHAADFPRSVLAEEREAGRVLALCALDRDDAAEQRAAFAKRWRGSPLLGRIERACKP